MPGHLPVAKRGLACQANPALPLQESFEEIPIDRHRLLTGVRNSEPPEFFAAIHFSSKFGT
jgi:hypothetical protein